MWQRTAIDEVHLLKRKPKRAYIDHVESERDRLEAILFPVISRHLRRAKQVVVNWAATQIRKQVAPDPNLPEWWGEWATSLAADLNAALVPWLANVFAVEIAMAVTPTAGFIVSKEAVSAAQQYSYHLVTRMSTVQQTQLQAQMGDWWANDEDMRALNERISPIFGADRADLIATTEATRINAMSRQDFYAQRGVHRMEWRSERDSLVCDLCAPLDGEQFDINDDGAYPPEHPGCRCNAVPADERDDVSYSDEEGI